MSDVVLFTYYYMSDTEMSDSLQDIKYLKVKLHKSEDTDT